MRPPSLNSFFAHTRSAKKVLVVDLGFLGDLLQVVPALWEIRRHYPSAALHVLSSTLGAEALGLLPCLDRIWSVHLKREQRSLQQHLQVLRGLRAERFDLGFTFNVGDRSLILTRLSGARWRVAPAGSRRRFWERWLVDNRVALPPSRKPVFELHRQFLAACGLELQPPRFDLRVPEQDLAWAARQVPAGAIHLSINSANPYKEWPLDHHVRLLQLLWKQQPELRVLASSSSRPREVERVQTLGARLNDPRFVPLPCDLSIAQLAAVLTRCRVQLGPDSGVMHLAVALQVPTVSFFRDFGGFNGWRPQGAFHQVLSAPCHCVDHHDAPCEQLGAPVCLAGIPPETVAATVLEQLARTGGSAQV